MSAGILSVSVNLTLLFGARYPGDRSLGNKTQQLVLRRKEVILLMVPATLKSSRTVCNDNRRRD